MKMLTINFGGLGDEVLFIPTLKSIKQEIPQCHITLLTEPRSRSITQLTHLIDANICFDIKKRPLMPADFMNLIKLLREGNYDLVLSSGGSAQVSVLLFLSGIRQRIGYDSGLLSRLLLTAAVPLNKNQYAGDMYHDLTKGLGINKKAEPPVIDLEQSSLERMSNFLAKAIQDAGNQTGVRRVLIHPGTSQLAIQKGIFKTWATENWCELIRRLREKGCDVILAGGPDDEKSIGDITTSLKQLAISNNRGNFINAYGHTKSVSDLAALIQLTDLVICVDSAPMHIAAGLNKRIVALFGPTPPDKLLLQSNQVIALKDNDYSKHPTESGVQIPLDTVYRTAEDQLSQISSPESSQGSQPR